MKKLYRQNVLKRVVLVVFSSLFICSCHEEDSNDNFPEVGQIVTKGILHLKPTLSNSITRATGYLPNDDEYIYNLGIYIYDEKGQLINYKFRKREEISTSQRGITKKYDKTYETYNVIKGIEVISGVHDVYIVANVYDEDKFTNRDNFRTLSGFNNLTESLIYQGEYMINTLNNGEYDRLIQIPNSSSTIPGWEDYLTMFAAYKGMEFPEIQNNGKEIIYYMGYSNHTLDEPSTQVEVAVIGNISQNPIEEVILERLVARIAITEITFGLPDELEFEDGLWVNKANYEYLLDSVFVMNVQMQSAISSDDNAITPNNFGHASQDIYNLFSQNDKISIAPGSQWVTNESLLKASIKGDSGGYDSEYGLPLWFYVFENQNPDYPTYFIIRVKYWYINASGTIKEIHCYYPVSIVDSTNKIQRNQQHKISVKITGLGIDKGTGIIRTVTKPVNQVLEVNSQTGDNLFPWVGQEYK